MNRTDSAQSGYIIRPNFQKKFRSAIAKQCIHDVLLEELADQDYNPATVAELSRRVADALRNKLKELELENYKFITQVVIGEQRGAGAKMVARCLWDSDTDNYAHDIFINKSHKLSKRETAVRDRLHNKEMSKRMAQVIAK